MQVTFDPPVSGILGNGLMAFLFMILSGMGDYFAFRYADTWVAHRVIHPVDGGMAVFFFMLGGVFYLLALVFLDRIIPIPTYGKILLWFCVVTVADTVYGGVFVKMSFPMQVFAIAIALQGALFAFLSSQYSGTSS